MPMAAAGLPPPPPFFLKSNTSFGTEISLGSFTCSSSREAEEAGADDPGAGHHLGSPRALGVEAAGRRLESPLDLSPNTSPNGPSGQAGF
jgi:hypothetical protein